MIRRVFRIIKDQAADSIIPGSDRGSVFSLELSYQVLTPSVFPLDKGKDALIGFGIAREFPSLLKEGRAT